ncbi:hypothetical protein GCM10017673_40150 [Streptosporangium violaceochromogenes]|nr:hypothetical protein GCM10017673_40150 [Streptosporangium violaceochromogenes]
MNTVACSFAALAGASAVTAAWAACVRTLWAAALAAAVLVTAAAAAAALILTAAEPEQPEADPTVVVLEV